MRELVARALAEDLGDGDVTSEATVPAERTATARIVQKAPGVVFGLDLVAETMAQAGVGEVETLVAEGEWFQDLPVEVLVARGSARAILAAERTALNFLGHLSGVATLTARYVGAVAGTKARILDTRKTTPGLRRLEKAAVAAGGGTVRRIGLFDAFLIKENHIAAAGSIVEVRNLDETAYALGTGADELLLDNMDPPTMRAAVELRDANSRNGKPTLEASGNVNLETVRAVAESGVDFISVGALTHSAPVLDFSLLLSAD
ncbi:MAG: carboxylating nicotinate-nucleotide diphosphorylase [Actinobacteria bacterium]|nr:carboxylating nicotinate-nucleotide diphosphorylase [Actinomycetota bacterium]